MAQLLVPTSDQSTGSWTNAPLWSKADTDDNTDAISDAVGNNTDTSNADLKLASGSTPGAGTQTLRVRWHHDEPGRSMQGTCELYEGDPAAGGTLVTTLQSATDVGTTEVEDSTTVTGISDYTNLYIRLRGRGTGGGPSRSLHVDLVELSIPDSSGSSFSETLTTSIAAATAAVSALAAVAVLTTSIVGTVSASETLSAGENHTTSITATTTANDTYTPTGGGADWTLVDSGFDESAAANVLAVDVQEGDLIVVVSSERSGFSGTISVSDDGDAGNPYSEAPNNPIVWNSGDATFRTFADAWLKVANATDEGTLTVTVDDFGGNQYLSVVVLRPSGGANPLDLGSMIAQVGGAEDNVTSVTTASLSPSSATYLKLGVGVIKKDQTDHRPFTYDEDLTEVFIGRQAGDATGMAHGIAVDLDVESTSQALTFGVDVTAARTLLATYVLIPEDVGGFTETLTTSATATTTETDTQASSESLASSVASSTTASDSLSVFDSLSVSIAATTTGVDSLNAAETLTTSITATSTTADGLGVPEALTTSIIASTLSTDSHAGAEALTSSITATTTASDVLQGPGQFSENLTTSITASTAAQDTQAAVETLSASLVATTTTGDVLGATEALSSTITATTTSGDVLEGGGAFFENLSTTIAATTTTSDSGAFNEALASSITASTTTADGKGVSENPLTTALASSTAADVAALTETLGTTGTVSTTTSTTLTAVEMLSTSGIVTTTLVETISGSSYRLKVLVSGDLADLTAAARIDRIRLKGVK